MTNIAAHNERFIEEYILGFLWSYSMPFPLLVGIGVAPASDLSKGPTE
jgi:hypothetical protein